MTVVHRLALAFNPCPEPDTHPRLRGAVEDLLRENAANIALDVSHRVRVTLRCLGLTGIEVLLRRWEPDGGISGYVALVSGVYETGSEDRIEAGRIVDAVREQIDAELADILPVHIF